MLMQIPGISSNVANQLISQYKSIDNLIKNLRENKDCLDNFKIKNKNSDRKISKTIIFNIKDYLLT